MTNLYNQEMREYIVTEHNAELINKDQPSMEDVITANAGEDMIKESGIEEVTNPTPRVLLKTTSDCCNSLRSKKLCNIGSVGGMGRYPSLADRQYTIVFNRLRRCAQKTTR